jgi:hypothetical protein
MYFVFFRKKAQKDKNILFWSGQRPDCTVNKAENRFSPYPAQVNKPVGCIKFRARLRISKPFDTMVTTKMAAGQRPVKSLQLATGITAGKKLTT